MSVSPTKKSFEMTIFLPPAKKVWGKVIFLHLSAVILFTGGGGVCSRCVCLVWGVSALRDVCSRGVWSGGGAGGDPPGWLLLLETPPGMVTAAGGTHTTAMHSC